MPATRKAVYPAVGPAVWPACGLPVYEGGGSGVAPFVGVLDQYPDALSACIGAWSAARRLTGTYSDGPLRVRESAANNAADIPFDAGGLTDEAVLATLVGSNNGLVTRLYGQVLGNNLVLTTAGNQPPCVSSGSIIKTGGRVCADFIAASTHGLEITGLTTINTAALTVIAIAALDSAATQYARLVAVNKTGQQDVGAASGNPILRQGGEHFQGYAAGGFGASVATTYGTVRRITSVFTGTQHRIGTNAAAPVTVTRSSAFEINEIRLGRGNVPTFGFDPWDGKVAELLIFTGELAAPTLAGIEADIDAFYGV